MTGVLLLVLAHVALAQDVSAGEVEGGSEGWGQVAVTNPCDHYRCGSGSVCVPIVNDLLQLPVAHCVEKTNGDKTEENGPCSTYDMGVSVVTCRTEAQWRAAATSRCGLGIDSNFTAVKVRHPCHRRGPASPAVFLQATFSCCSLQATEVQLTESETPPTSTDAPPTTLSDTVAPPALTYEDVISSDEDEEEGERGVEGEEGEGEGGRALNVVVIVSLSGCVILLVVTIATIKILRRRKRRSSLYKPRLEFVTAYINPSSEGWREGEGSGVVTEKTEFSYTVANSNTLPGSG